MSDWENDETRDAILASLVAAQPPPPRPGDFTKAQYAQALGLSEPTAAYRLKAGVRAGEFETQECTINGRTVRVWRKVP